MLARVVETVWVNLSILTICSNRVLDAMFDLKNNPQASLILVRRLSGVHILLVAWHSINIPRPGFGRINE